MITPFAAILQRAVQATPNAIGGAFADADGEMVDSFSTIDPHEWAVITAHYGVVLAQVSAAFGTWHFGGPEYFFALHKQLDVIVHSVEGGYYALIATRTPANLGMTLETMRTAAIALRKEM